MAAGAALMGAEACSNAVPVYGAPTGAGGNMTTTDGGSDAPTDVGGVPIYGAPAPSDEPAQK
jgi:hypothetical protein